MIVSSTPVVLAFAGMPGGNLKEFGDIMTNCSYPSSRSRMAAASFVGS